MAATEWAAFERRMHELVDLGGVAGLMGWDQQVMMPPKGAETRAHQSTALASLLHERVVDQRSERRSSRLRRPATRSTRLSARASARRDATATAP